MAPDDTQDLAAGTRGSGSVGAASLLLHRVTREHRVPESVHVACNQRPETRIPERSRGGNSISGGRKVCPFSRRVERGASAGLQRDLGPREIAILAPLAVLVILLGLRPTLVTEPLEPLLAEQVLARIEQVRSIESPTNVELTLAEAPQNTDTDGSDR